MLPPYAELHCLSNFSFLRGASHPEELAERAHAQGYAALALTDECSVAGVVRGHLAAKEAGLPFVIGSEFTLADGLKLVLYATDRESYGDLTQLITRGRRNATKGSYALTRDDVAQWAPRCPALWIPACTTSDLDQRTIADARWFADIFPGRAWIAAELLARSGDRARLAQLQALAKMSGLPLVAAGDVHMHARARRALQDTLTAIRLRTPLTECGYALFPNGERHLRSRARIATLFPRELTDATLDVVERCTFSLDELRYEYPEELVPAGATPSSHLRALVETGLVRRFGDGPIRPDVRELIDYELSLIAELQYEPYFLTVHDIVAFAREKEILCQGRGSAANSAVCYALGITEVDPSRMSRAVRALHQPRAQRAARHRRRLRAPAARGSDAVRLPQIRPRTRRAGGHAHHLPAEERGTRCRQGARPRSRASGAADGCLRVVGWPQDRSRAHPRGGFRPGQSADRPAGGA